MFSWLPALQDPALRPATRRGLFGPIAGILLIVAAGGGFKQTLVDSGIADVIAKTLSDAALPPLLAGWIVAVLIRLATGSATVATITASGIMALLAAGLSSHTALMVLAIGSGSVFLSHVNDAGFWMVKEYFGMTVGETFKTWSLMETVMSVVGLGSVMLLSLVVRRDARHADGMIGLGRMGGNMVERPRRRTRSDRLRPQSGGVGRRRPGRPGRRAGGPAHGVGDGAGR